MKPRIGTRPTERQENMRENLEDVSDHLANVPAALDALLTGSW